MLGCADMIHPFHAEALPVPVKDLMFLLLQASMLKTAEYAKTAVLASHLLAKMSPEGSTAATPFLLCLRQRSAQEQLSWPHPCWLRCSL